MIQIVLPVKTTSKIQLCIEGVDRRLKMAGKFLLEEKVAETKTSCSMLTLSYNFFVHTWETCQIETFNLNAQNQGKNITLHCNLQTSTKRH